MIVFHVEVKVLLCVKYSNFCAISTVKAVAFCFYFSTGNCDISLQVNY